jgi:ketosteroid isomerase-like protein
MKKIILFSAFAFLAVNLFAQNKQQAEVEAVLKEFRQAILDGDSATLDKLTDSDLTYGHSLGKLENKQQFIHALASGESDYQTYEVVDQKFYAARKDIAVVRQTFTANITDAGKYNTVTLAVMFVFHKDHKQWKLIARQAIRPPAPQS